MAENTSKQNTHRGITTVDPVDPPKTNTEYYGVDPQYIGAASATYSPNPAKFGKKGNAEGAALEAEEDKGDSPKAPETPKA